MRNRSLPLYKLSYSIHLSMYCHGTLIHAPIRQFSLPKQIYMNGNALVVLSSGDGSLYRSSTCLISCRGYVNRSPKSVYCGN